MSTSNVLILSRNTGTYMYQNLPRVWRSQSRENQAENAGLSGDKRHRPKPGFSPLLRQTCPEPVEGSAQV